MNWKLVNEQGEEVTLPHTCKTFRGEDVTVIEARPPHKPGSSGFIYIDDGWYGIERYPSVCNLKWEKRDENNSGN